MSLDGVPLLERAEHSDLWRKHAVIWLILAITVLGLSFSLVFGLKGAKLGKIKRGVGAIVSNGESCADVGRKMLNNGGSAVDAAIATLLCEGVLLPNSLGLGGGFMATIYTKKTGKIETLMARETAPARAHQDMYLNKKITGAISAAVPSEIYGYWRLHEKYGKLPWKALFEPTIELCKKGYRVSKYLETMLNSLAERIRNEPSMADIFVDPKTNNVYREGDLMYRPQLGDTLTIVAEEGPGAIYRGGRIGKLLAEDIQQMGGIITEEDLQNYEVRWEQPIVVNFSGGYSLYTTPLPTSGTVLAFILKVMEPLYTDRNTVYWQRLIETFKHAYGYRSNLGDVHFEPEVQELTDQFSNPQFIDEVRQLIRDDRTYTNFAYYRGNFSTVEDHGTANIAVLATNGDAILMTSTINSAFGAKVRSRRTGIILNDEMDDFSTANIINAYGIPPSCSNFIKPGKRPLSSACPSIVLDKAGNVQMLVGGAGGAKITTSVAQSILRYFVLNESIQDAINLPRIHHQLSPMQVDVELDVPKEVNNYLVRVGHKLNFLSRDKSFSALTAIGLKTGEPIPVCDRRRLGSSITIYPKDSSENEC